MKGSGVFLVFVRKKTGAVTNVKISKSTGYKALDVAATSAFSRWRFRPGTGLDGLIIPVTFTF
jgi:TonB family protein